MQGYDRPVSIPLYLTKCQHAQKEIENLLLSYHPENSSYAKCRHETKTLLLVRQRIEECLTFLRHAGMHLQSRMSH